MHQSVPLRLTALGLKGLLDAALQPTASPSVAGVLSAPFLGLFTEWPGFSPGLAIGDLEEPIYGTYARVAVVWGDPGIDKMSRPEVVAESIQFQPDDDSESSTIIGVFLASDDTGGDLLGVGLLTSTVVLATPEDLLALIARVAIPGYTTPDWGELVAVS